MKQNLKKRLKLSFARNNFNDRFTSKVDLDQYLPYRSLRHRNQLIGMCDHKAPRDLSERLHVRLEWIQSIENQQDAREWKNIGELARKSSRGVGKFRENLNFYFFCDLSAFSFFPHDKEKKAFFFMKESLKIFRWRSLMHRKMRNVNNVNNVNKK